MSAGAAERLALAPELRRAIPAGELVLHYQPKLDVRTGRPAGVEALVRWDRPGHGLVAPDVFIGLAERTGLIRPLTTWVLERAVADQARWAAAGHRIAVAVNLSTRAILPGVVDDVAALLARGAGELELEITESAAMHDLEGSLAVLGSLAALGVRLSVDDFGTGHSSLAYLERLPVAALKIDRGFVAGLEPGRRTAASSTRRSSSPTGSGSRWWPRASRTTPRSPSCARWAATSRRASASRGRCRRTPSRRGRPAGPPGPRCPCHRDAVWRGACSATPWAAAWGT